MSDDLEVLKGIFGIDCHDEDAIDRILDAIETQELAESEKYQLCKGRVVHRVELDGNLPATVQCVELNMKLEKDIVLSKYNHLDSNDVRSPGSWFVERGYKVRSIKEHGKWIQYAFHPGETHILSRGDIIEYCTFSKLDFNSDEIPEFSFVRIKR